MLILNPSSTDIDVRFDIVWWCPGVDRPFDNLTSKIQANNINRSDFAIRQRIIQLNIRQVLIMFR